ncbi:MAG: hypothetical protein H7269_15300, partial [Cellulomonas sp.]|nr:hypothetical protein [Cellulomonas sp.]
MRAPLSFLLTDPRVLTATDPDSTLGKATKETGEWFDALITPAWQIALTLVIGAISLALLRRFIARTVRHLADGAPALQRNTGRLTRGLRQDGGQV